MKKLLVLLAALSLVACSSKEPKKEVVEPTPTTTEAPAMQEKSTTEETPAVEETTTEEETPAMEETTPAEETPAIEEAPTEEPETYTIQYGDNLYRIGLKYNMSWEKLADTNGISDPNVIIAGDELTIPAE